MPKRHGFSRRKQRKRRDDLTITSGRHRTQAVNESVRLIQQLTDENIALHIQLEEFKKSLGPLIPIQVSSDKSLNSNSKLLGSKRTTVEKLGVSEKKTPGHEPILSEMTDRNNKLK